MRLAYQIATPEVHTRDVTAFRGKLDAAFALAAECGYAGVELMMRDASENEPATIGRLAARHGVQISMCCSGEMFGEDRLSFTDVEDSVRQAAVWRALDLLEFAAALGVGINVGRLRGRYRSGVARSQTEAWARQALEACIERAASLGSVVLLEPLGPAAGNFLNTTTECVEFVRSLDSPHFALMTDIGHTAANGEDLAAALATAGELNRYVHLTDDRRRPPGSGSVDFAGVIETLRAQGYDGWLAVEVYQRPDGPTAMRQSAEVLLPLLAATPSK